MWARLDRSRGRGLNLNLDSLGLVRVTVLMQSRFRVPVFRVTVFRVTIRVKVRVQCPKPDRDTPRDTVP